MAENKTKVDETVTTETPEVKKEAKKTAKKPAKAKAAKAPVVKEEKAEDRKLTRNEKLIARKAAKLENASQRGIAIAKNIRMSPLKVRIVLDLIRGKKVDEAIAILLYTPKDAATVVLKVLQSAAANAENNQELDKDKLYVSQCFVGAGPIIKRYQPHAQGRAFSIMKRTSHITVEVRERA